VILLLTLFSHGPVAQAATLRFPGEPASVDPGVEPAAHVSLRAESSPTNLENELVHATLGAEPVSDGTLSPQERLEALAGLARVKSIGDGSGLVRFEAEPQPGRSTDQQEATSSSTGQAAADDGEAVVEDADSVREGRLFGGLFSLPSWLQGGQRRGPDAGRPKRRRVRPPRPTGRPTGPRPRPIAPRPTGLHDRPVVLPPGESFPGDERLPGHQRFPDHQGIVFHPQPSGSHRVAAQQRPVSHDRLDSSHKAVPSHKHVLSHKRQSVHHEPPKKDVHHVHHHTHVYVPRPNTGPGPHDSAPPGTGFIAVRPFSEPPQCAACNAAPWRWGRHPQDADVATIVGQPALPPTSGSAVSFEEVGKSQPTAGLPVAAAGDRWNWGAGDVTSDGRDEVSDGSDVISDGRDVITIVRPPRHQVGRSPAGPSVVHAPVESAPEPVQPAPGPTDSAYEPDNSYPAIHTLAQAVAESNIVSTVALEPPTAPEVLFESPASPSVSVTESPHIVTPETPTVYVTQSPPNSVYVQPTVKPAAFRPEAHRRPVEGALGVSRPQESSTEVYQRPVESFTEIFAGLDSVTVV